MVYRMTPKIADEQELLEPVQTCIPSARRVLAFAPHPDDEVFGCGGMLALLHGKGASISVVIITDGAAGGDNTDGTLSEVRAAESRAASHVLGIPEPTCWGMPDRGLVYGEELVERLKTAISDAGADLVLLPSPTEVHPDHQALALAGAEAVRRLGADLRALFYEINLPLPDPNLVVDITSVFEQKRSAMGCFPSQLAEQPYDQRISGLNQFRSYFLGPQVVAAEAYILLEAASLETGLFRLFEGPLPGRNRLGCAASKDDFPLVSVIVRSMDRLSLEEALTSIFVQLYPNIEVIVVNSKGGEHYVHTEHCGQVSVRLINQGGPPLSRSAAANAGLHASQGDFIAFLDDDDVILPEHISGLVAEASKQTQPTVVYSAAKGMHRGEPPTLLRIFAEPHISFPELLLCNSLPIHTVLFPATVRKAGAAFDESLDVYEDWDFWLQLAKQFPFVFLNQETAIYYLGGDSGVSPFGDQKQQIEKALSRFYSKWQNHLPDGGLLDLRSLYYEHTQRLSQREVELVHEIENKDLQIADRDAQVADRDAQIESCLQQLSAFQRSTSWQITKPLRRARWVVSQLCDKTFYKTRIRVFVTSFLQTLPLSARTKQRLKNQLFKRLPILFRHTGRYKNWLSLKQYTNQSTKAWENDLSAEHYVPLIKSAPVEESVVRLLCFYLPQFHTIPENDAWWGDGFTEWTNVKRAEPYFLGHYQPHEPGALGYYSLFDSAVQKRQVELAMMYGVSGFCFYFYWFGGKRLLEMPLLSYLQDDSLRLPFCLCWANENWTRRWDGLDNEVLISQQHSHEDDLAFIKHVSQYMSDPRYIRIGDKPLLLVYRPGLLPKPIDTALRWRKWCRENGLGEIYLAYTQSFDNVDPAKYGFDAAIEFPPNNSSAPVVTETLQELSGEFKGNIYDWRFLAEKSRSYNVPAYKLFRGVNPSWDNSARKKNKASIFVNSSPAGYHEWLFNAIEDTIKRFRQKDERLVFVNAWNEWAEGAHLEPDKKTGYAYLEATRIAQLRSALLFNQPVTQRVNSLAIVVHAFYPDVFNDICNQFPAAFQKNSKLFISTSDEHAEAVRHSIQDLGLPYEIFIVENRGRDVLPLLEILPTINKQGFLYVLKLHTKKSKHRKDGDLWRDDICAKLLNDSLANRIVDYLANHSSVGIVGPEGYLAPMSLYWGANAHNVRSIGCRLGVAQFDHEETKFVAGTMFYARLNALMPLSNLAIAKEDFEPENGQMDGTLAHAIERAITLSAMALKMEIVSTQAVFNQGPEADKEALDLSHFHEASGV